MILHQGRWVHAEKLTGQGTGGNLVPCLNLLGFFDGPVGKELLIRKSKLFFCKGHMSTMSSKVIGEKKFTEAGYF